MSFDINSNYYINISSINNINEQLQQPNEDLDLLYDFPSESVSDEFEINLKSLDSYPQKYTKEEACELVNEFNIFNVGCNPQGAWAENTQISKEIVSDLNMLRYARDNGLKVEDVFVKKYASESEAINNAQTGEVLQLKGADKISIKEADGTLTQLDISQEKYLELFPPVERYAYKQGRVNDCYLVSTLDSLMKSPETRSAVLSCFHEYKDGSVTVKYPKGQSVFNVAKGKHTEDYVVPSDVKFHGQVTIASDNPEDSLAMAPEGIQMLEHLYGLELLTKEVNRSDIADDLVNALNSPEQDLGKIAELNHYYEEALKNGERATELRGSAGMAFDVYHLFDSQVVVGSNVNNSDDVKNVLVSPSEWGSHVIIASSFGGNSELGIYGSHAYSIQPYQTQDGTPRYKVTNPWNTTVNMDLSYAEVAETFKLIEVAKFVTG